MMNYYKEKKQTSENREFLCYTIHIHMNLEYCSIHRRIAFVLVRLMQLKILKYNISVSHFVVVIVAYTFMAVLNDNEYSNRLLKCHATINDHNLVGDQVLMIRLKKNYSDYDESTYIDIPYCFTVKVEEMLK